MTATPPGGAMDRRAEPANPFRLVAALRFEMPILNRIAIYPLKSFDPWLVSQAWLLDNGALRYDRQFAFADSTGRMLTAKRTAHVHPLQVHLDPVARSLSARRRSDDKIFQWHIDSDRASLQLWFSDYFGFGLTLEENTTGGFPDDLQAPGPTIVSTQTLQSVVDWFPGLTLDQVRLRFRANLEIDAEEPFWEDHLFGTQPDTARLFRIGEVVLAGTNPCQRCVVPSRDPESGIVWPEFAKHFSERRASELPPWAPRTRFDHTYRLTVNTRLVSRGPGQIQLGNPVELFGDQPTQN